MKSILAAPFYGSRRITAQLNRDQDNHEWNRKQIQRLMRIMGIRGVAPDPDTSKSHPENKNYPYLLRNKVIDSVNQVWSTDISYIPMTKGFMYLVAVIDWYSPLCLVMGTVQYNGHDVKYENIYISDYQTVAELRLGLKRIRYKF